MFVLTFLSFFCFFLFFFFCFFFFNDPATTEIYTLSLHDALPSRPVQPATPVPARRRECPGGPAAGPAKAVPRSEEHTSELQSRQYLVCRLLLEKKKKKQLSILHIKKKKKKTQT